MLTPCVFILIDTKTPGTLCRNTEFTFSKVTPTGHCPKNRVSTAVGHILLGLVLVCFPESALGDLLFSLPEPWLDH